jgi:uncharacterized metal-binding protein
MASKVDRRRFLKSSGMGIAAGAAAAVTASALAAENPATSPAVPVPDTQTKRTVPKDGPQPACSCAAPKLIFACSGASDVGKIADLAARKLTEEGVAKMSCLAGVGGRVNLIMDATKSAQAILVIDGCLQQCARKTMKQAGFTTYEYLSLHDMGMEKGKTPATEKAVTKVASRGKALLLKQHFKKGEDVYG